MFVADRTKFASLFFEAAGGVGLVATLVACSLVYSGAAAGEFWTAVAFSLGGNAIFITRLLAQRATGQIKLTWREMVLANIVPFVAFAVTVVLAAVVSGLVRLPSGGLPAGL